ncbi:MAG: TIGR00730 family Rossman fold protein [Candidatus Brocadiae bacterium]|nr:TIGR00730 family Rossman fold protein [Candidatus Brocadiia bacterium]
MKNICIYCGSSQGSDPVYIQSAREIGKIIAQEGLTLVYGGGNVGLMGAVADAAMENSGRVIGVITKLLFDKELAHPNLTELHVVNSMHERKSLMANLADCFLALPGGLGTMDEIFEVCVWTQLGIHKKACGFLNIQGFYDDLLKFLDNMVEKQFLKQNHHSQILTSSIPKEIIKKLLETKVEASDKWIDRKELLGKC